MIALEVLGYLAPIAFVFAIAAYSQAAGLQKQVGSLKAEVEELKQKVGTLTK